eukprot:6596102-Pyramimonas_sp.AAC.1
MVVVIVVVVVVAVVITGLVEVVTVVVVASEISFPCMGGLDNVGGSFPQAMMPLLRHCTTEECSAHL